MITRNSAISDKTCNAFVQYAMAWLAPSLKHASPHMCYHAGFGHSVSKGVNINRGKHKNCGALFWTWSWNSLHTTVISSLSLKVFKSQLKINFSV